MNTPKPFTEFDLFSNSNLLAAGTSGTSCATRDAVAAANVVSNSLASPADNNNTSNSSPSNFITPFGFDFSSDLLLENAFSSAPTPQIPVTLDTSSSAPTSKRVVVSKPSSIEEAEDEDEEEEEGVEKSSNTVREWRVSNVNTKHVCKQEYIQCLLKTRGLSATTAIPERLYSSIKYELLTRVDPGGLCNVAQTKFLLAKVQVVDAESLTEIRKSNQKCILDGVCETSMLPDRDTGVFNSLMKIQFTDVSYHHSRREFAFKVSYYLNNELDQPFIEMVSPGFLVLARKPQKRGKKDSGSSGSTKSEKPKVEKKRSRPAAAKKKEAEVVVIEDEKAAKKKKEAPPSKPAALTPMKDFELKLADMMGTLEMLDGNLKSQAINQIFKELYPHLSSMSSTTAPATNMMPAFPQFPTSYLFDDADPFANLTN